VQFPHKSGASLGLMVLLCALPTLLSMPTQSALPTTFSLPVTGASTFSASSSAFDYNSLIPNDWDWSHTPSNGAMMDLDVDDQGENTNNVPPTTGTRKLEFVDGALAGLGDLDISFDTSLSDDRKILVRIHPSSSQSPTVEAKSIWTRSQSHDFGMPNRPEFGYDTPSDPFLGIGSTEFTSLYPSDASSSMSLYGGVGDMSPGTFASAESDFGFRSDGDSCGKRRVRIALKSVPASGREGGEWEVQVC